jgi:uncharacterized repeat protein (TIGR01451 family)
MRRGIAAFGRTSYNSRPRSYRNFIGETMIRFPAHLSLALILLASAANPVPAAPPTPTAPSAAPLVFNVNNTADVPDKTPGDLVCDIGDVNGSCTLRAANMEANASVTQTADIILPSNTYTLTLSGANEDQSATGDLDILVPLRIVGVGQATPIIAAAWPTDTDRMVQISGTVPITVTIQNVTITGGNVAGPGGGIYSKGAIMNLNSVTVFSNTADNGGGLYIDGGSPTLSTLNIYSNTATQNGGGVYSVGTSPTSPYNVSSSVIMTNTATNGGGFYVASGMVSMSGASVKDNIASGDGGGVFNQGSLNISNASAGTGSLAANHAQNGGGLANLGVITQLYRVLLVGNTAAQSGGGIQNAGQLKNAYENQFTSNAAGSTGEGGGLHNSGSADIYQSSFYSNTAGFGGGVSSSGNLTVTNSTLSSNSASDSGGGVIADAGGTAFFNSATIVSNTVGVGDGGGISVTITSIVSLTNTLLALNVDGAGPAAPDCAGAVTSLGNNLIGDTTGCTLTQTTGDQFGSAPTALDPLIGPAQANGGTTLNHALLAGSPALDKGGCLLSDQRGKSRPQGNGCDIGAFELEAADLSFLSTTDAPDPVYVGSTLTYTLAVTNAGQSTAANVTVSDNLPPGAVYNGFLGAGWSCVYAGGVVTCGLSGPLLKNTASASLAITLTAPVADPPGPPLITNTVSVTSTVYDANFANNTVTQTTTVTPIANLRLIYVFAPQTPQINSPLTYTVSVMNDGPSQATSVTLTDTLPTSVAFASLAGPFGGGNCWPVGAPVVQVVCSIDAINANTGDGLVLVVTPTVTGLITNTLTVTGAQYDPLLSNNTQNIVLTVSNFSLFLPLIMRGP